MVTDIVFVTNAPQDSVDEPNDRTIDWKLSNQNFLDEVVSLLKEWYPGTRINGCLESVYNTKIWAKSDHEKEEYEAQDDVLEAIGSVFGSGDFWVFRS